MNIAAYAHELFSLSFEDNLPSFLTSLFKLRRLHLSLYKRRIILMKNNEYGNNRSSNNLRYYVEEVRKT
jgi:hypothetical protein